MHSALPARNAGRWLVMLLAAALLSASSGCAGGTDSSTLPEAAIHIQKLASLYNRYRTERGKPPANASELKEFCKKLKPEFLKELGINNLDSAFVSPRDNQPYVVQSAGMGAYQGQKGAPQMVAIYEKTGQGGKRWVAFAQGSVAELDEEKFKLQVPKP